MYILTIKCCKFRNVPRITQHYCTFCEFEMLYKIKLEKHASEKLLTIQVN